MQSVSDNRSLSVPYSRTSMGRAGALAARKSEWFQSFPALIGSPPE
ncbi:MAG: hypothetical protein JNL32_06245 [Candidatus Kapabacteria bacterium]|nr:hypothetical protein [Candidatus Kapabacteria bacterium]